MAMTNYYWKTAGFYNEAVNVASCMKLLETHIKEVPFLFKGFTEQQLVQKPAPGKWSKKEILGHLIDSALNNLQRFTEVQFLPRPYYIVSYRQNELVDVNHYQELPTNHLVELWCALNKQVMYVVQKMPGENFEFPVDPKYDNGEMRTLGWIICDYVAHMEHHLNQITAKEGTNS